MDFYKILSINKNATQAEIKGSFRKLALIYHPDVTGNDTTKTERFREIKKAYDILHDDITRNKYDNEIGNRRAYMRTQTSYSGPSTTSSSHTYTEAGKTYTYKYTVTRSNTTSSSKSTSRHPGINMDEWNAWHYGDNVVVTDSVSYKSRFVKDMENNKHYQYYSKKRTKEREQFARMMEEENERIQRDADNAAEKMKNRREERRQGKSHSHTADVDQCVIS